MKGLISQLSGLKVMLVPNILDKSYNIYIDLGKFNSKEEAEAYLEKINKDN